MANTKLAALNRRGNKKLITIRFDNNHDAPVVFSAHLTDEMDSSAEATYALTAVDANSPAMVGTDISRFYSTFVIQAPAVHPEIQPEISIDGTNWSAVPLGWTGQAVGGDTLLAEDGGEILIVSLPCAGVRLRLTATVPAMNNADNQDDFIVTVMLTDSSERADIGRA